MAAGGLQKTTFCIKYAIADVIISILTSKPIECKTERT